jgi:hypothetical protein
MSSASSQEKLVTRWWKISITRARRRTAGGRPNTAGRTRSGVAARRCPRSWSCEHRESRLATNPQWTSWAGAGSAAHSSAHYFVAPEKGDEWALSPAASDVVESVNRTFPHACFTGGISMRGCGVPETLRSAWSGSGNRTASTRRHGLCRPAAEAGRTTPRNRSAQLGRGGGNVTATLNSCAAGLVDPEFSEPRL